MNQTFVEQVGGSHYSSRGDAHWDVMERYDVAYLEATASKYTTRYLGKGKPREDLLKGKSYLVKLLSERSEVRRRVPACVIEQLVRDTGQTHSQALLLHLIHVEGHNVDLITAIGVIDALLVYHPE